MLRLLRGVADVDVVARRRARVVARKVYIVGSFHCQDSGRKKKVIGLRTCLSC